MSKQENKRQRIYDLLNAGTKSKFICLLYTKQRNFITAEELFTEKGSGAMNKKRKKAFFNCSLFGD